MDIHRQLWATHQSIGAGPGHAYCSPWYSWPLMLRPVAYFYERTGQGLAATATTIHGMGNPVLWWLSTAAMLCLGLSWLARRLAGRTKGSARVQHSLALGTPALPSLRSEGRTDGVALFILLNYLANWLPWALVGRCTFLYHAMGMAAVSTLGLAWLMVQWWETPAQRRVALGLLGAIALSFWFWLPLYLGLPLPYDALQRRWLLPGWI